MLTLFAAIEQSAPSIWMREDAYAYFVALIFHAFGMALLVGGGLALSLCMAGAAPRVELDRLRGFLPVMWLGTGLAVVSGVLLLVAYPAKALTNPVFAVKFACFVGAALLLRAASRRLMPAQRGGGPAGRGRTLAAMSLVLWLGGVAAGKLLLHTARILTVT